MINCDKMLRIPLLNKFFPRPLRTARLPCTLLINLFKMCIKHHKMKQLLLPKGGEPIQGMKKLKGMQGMVLQNGPLQCASVVLKSIQRRNWKNTLKGGMLMVFTLAHGATCRPNSKHLLKSMFPTNILRSSTTGVNTAPLTKQIRKL